MEKSSKSISQSLAAATVLALSLSLLSGCVPVQTNAPAAAPTGSGLSAGEVSQILAYHNRKRAEVGSPSVTWSPEVARYAQERANTIAKTRRFGHLPPGLNPYGENLAQGGSPTGLSGFSVLDACEGWYAEKSLMKPGERVLTSRLFHRGVGHYTQMVWKGTTEIGAGIAHFQEGEYRMTVVVCCYNPPGNRITDEIY